MVSSRRKCVLILCCLALALSSSACSEDKIDGSSMGEENDVEVDAGTDAAHLDGGSTGDADDQGDVDSESDVGDEGLDADGADTGQQATDTDGTDVEADTGGADTGSTDAGADTGDADVGADTGGDMDAGGFDTGGDTDTDAGGDTDAGDGNGDDPPTGLSEPCENGPGWTVFRFHYNNNSTSAQIQIWDASCDYSFASNSACNVREVTSGFGDINRTSEGFPIVTSSNYIRVRYSVEDLQFDTAEVHLKARSVSTSASTNYELLSPIYGSIIDGPVSVGFSTQWYSADWSDHLSPTDDPAMTAIQLYAQGGSNQLAIESVELCVDQ